MQFVPNGPDVPDELLQAHEEGRVVFFCGAGISYPAGLPDFQGLVEKIYTTLREPREPMEGQMFDQGQFDATLNLLEDRLPGRRAGLQMRKALASCLQPRLRTKSSTETHEALLQLSRTRGGKLHLVTTNFDQVFERAGRRSNIPFARYSAPMLPVPKNSRWDGLVYLHGLLPKRADAEALNRLVVTSADFGLAYLTERWAARFVSELFRNYVVCFIGYSINDPVMRYMMDALAADRVLGEATPQAWAFGSASPGEEKKRATEWSGKGVEPVLYEVAAGPTGHAALRDTLTAWANTYRDGVNGKSSIVTRHALARPSVSTQQDNFVGRMLWALSDDTGTPAKHFADFDPVPPLEWLQAFGDERFKHSDLPRYGVTPLGEVDAKLAFSLAHRPTPYHLADRMSLVSWAGNEQRWDKVMGHLGRWLTRHLNDPALVLWLADRGGQLHGDLAWVIERKLERLHEMEQAKNTAELAAIHANAPNAIPSPAMRQLWRLLLAGLVRSRPSQTDLRLWLRKLNREGLSASLRLEMREILAPRVTFAEPLRWGPPANANDGPRSIHQLVRCEVVLASGHVRSALRDLTSAAWSTALPNLLDDFQALLRDALDLLRDVDQAGDFFDRSHWGMPSISDHPQNQGMRDWHALIELVRDAWLQTARIDPARATRLAIGWFALPYPTFKRLALFAASQDGVVDPLQWLEWLASDNAWWLWTLETRREVLALLRLQGPTLQRFVLDKLEDAIQAGPPKGTFSDTITPDDVRARGDRYVWLRLAKLRSAGVALGQHAACRLDQLSQENPRWRLAVDHRDEFSHWIGRQDDSAFEGHTTTDRAPTKAAELASWLTSDPAASIEDDDDQNIWRETCRAHLLNSMCALQLIGRQDLWPERLWHQALQVWAERGRVRRSWQHGAALVESVVPENLFRALVHPISRWLREASSAGVAKRNRELMMRFCRRILSLDINPKTGILLNGEPIDQPVTEAINHPAGKVMQSLLDYLFDGEPSDDDRLPADLEELLTLVCDLSVAQYRHCRVVLTAHLPGLFRIDRSWTEAHLLPLLGWHRDVHEARALWQGFLWSARPYGPLLTALKDAFLETAGHYDALGDHAQQYAVLLTFAALEPPAGYSAKDFQGAFRKLPAEGLHNAAHTLLQAIDSAADRREEFWRNRAWNFLLEVWPKLNDRRSSAIAEDLALTAIAAGDEFPAAMDAVVDWLALIDQPSYLVTILKESGHCKRFPAHALTLLHGVMDEKLLWGWEEVGDCLDEIVQGAPPMAEDPRYKRLRQRTDL